MSWFVIFLRPFVVQVIGRVNKQTNKQNKTKQNKTKQIKSNQNKTKTNKNKNKTNKEGQHSHRPCIIMLSTGEM
jgi:hypothetical protein